MTNSANASAATAAELRRSFDQSFSHAPQRIDDSFVDLLAIRVAGAPYGLRLAHLSGLHLGRRIVPLPSPVPELLGLVGFRGNIIPVYSLRMLLGYSAGESPRWLALVGKDEMIGLAFDSFEGHLRATKSQVTGVERADVTSPHIHEVTEIDGAISAEHRSHVPARKHQESGVHVDVRNG